MDHAIKVYTLPFRLFKRLLLMILSKMKAKWRRDRYWQGRIVELMGNRVKLGGITVDLQDPYLGTELKGRFLKNIYEKEERVLFRRYFPKDMPIIELGGCIGVLSCIANRTLLHPRRHIVVEANPQLINVLDKNRLLNKCEFTIVNAALAYNSETVAFYIHALFVGGSIQRRTDKVVVVPAKSLQSLAESRSFDRFNLICDIEGGEVELIDHEFEYMRDHVGWLLVEMHGFIVGRRSVEKADIILRDIGFELVESLNGTFVYRNESVL